jgi:hypothetical protein
LVCHFFFGMAFRGAILGASEEPSAAGLRGRLLWHEDGERAVVASIPEAAGRTLVSDKLHSLRTAHKKVSSESEVACMDCNLLRKQVRDERDRRHSLPSEVVCLADRLKSARRKNVRLEDANEKLAAKQPAALSWHDHHCFLCCCKREFGRVMVLRDWPLSKLLATRCQQQRDDHRKWEADRNFGMLQEPQQSNSTFLVASRRRFFASVSCKPSGLCPTK